VAATIVIAQHCVAELPLMRRHLVTALVAHHEFYVLADQGLAGTLTHAPRAIKTF
jgi:hypothetical protein